MFLNARQFPEMRGLTGAEQNALLKAAVEAHDAGQWKRFVAALIAAISAGWLLDYLVTWLGIEAGPLQYAGMACTGLSFCAYLLWEINARTRPALLKYLATRKA